MMLGARLAAWNGEKLPYDMTNVIGMWDCEWNAGVGKHDSKYRITDLTKNGNDITLNPVCTIGDNYVSIQTSESENFVGGSADVSNLALGKGLCFDVVACVSTVISSWGCRNYIFNLNDVRIDVRESRYFYILGLSGDYTEKGFYTKVSNNEIFSAGANKFVGDDSKAFMNGTWVGLNNDAYFGSSIANTLKILETTTNGSYIIRLHHLRIYSGDITDNQRRYNYAIDKARFGLT